MGGDSSKPVRAETRQGYGGETGLPVVSDWYDAETMLPADLSGDVAGRQVVMSRQGDPKPFNPTIFAGLLPAGPGGHEVSGFLFSGDDGDSLWFWPQSSDLAYRFEPQVAHELRLHMSEDVSRAISQGAFLFCYRVAASVRPSEILRFPFVDELAA